MGHPGRVLPARGAVRPRRALSGAARRAAGRAAFLALGLLVAVALGVPSGGAQTGTPPPPGIDGRLFVIGDSVLLGAHDAIVARQAGWSVTVYAQEGLSTLGAASIVAASRAAIGEVAVVALGNNDMGNPATFGQRIDGVMTAMGPVRRVVWVNLRQFASWVPAMNQQLTLATARWPNLQIADWDSLATPNPALVYGDGLHLTPPGQGAMAQLVGQAIDAYVHDRVAASTTTTTLPPTTTSHPRRRHRTPAARFWPGLFGLV